MVKEYFSKGFRYFIALFGCLWATVLVCVITALAVRFVVKDSIEESVIQLIVMTVVMGIALFICAYRMGYTEREFDLKMVFIPMGIAVVLQLVYAALFSFSLYSAGPAYYAGKVLYMLHGVTEPGVPDGFVFPFVCFFDVLYIGIAAAGEYFGVKKRGLEREKTISGDTK